MKKNLIKESVSEGSGVVSSNGKNYKKGSGDTYKYVISYGNLRIVANSLPESHEEYSEDTFEYCGKFYNVGKLSPEAEDFVQKISQDPIFELRYGSYTAEKITGKR